MSKPPITVNGAAKLRVELAKLKEQRPKIIQAIAEARAMGDLKENAEYHAAKEQQGLVEARTRDLEYKLATCQIIDVTNIPNKHRIVFGATVTITNIETDATVTYQIVGNDESDLKTNKISIKSPLAQALIGKIVGDHVEATTPSGIVGYVVDKIEYI